MIDINKKEMLMIVHTKIEGEHINNRNCFCKPTLVELADNLTANKIQEQLDKESPVLG